MLSELWGFEFERRLKPLENTLDAFAFRTRLLCAAKFMSTWQHAALLRLQPHYVYHTWQQQRRGYNRTPGA
jgi:hypothetical protein